MTGSLNLNKPSKSQHVEHLITPDRYEKLLSKEDFNGLPRDDNGKIIINFEDYHASSSGYVQTFFERYMTKYVFKYRVWVIIVLSIWFAISLVLAL